MKKYSSLLAVLTIVLFATVAFAAVTSYKSPTSINETIQVKNTGSATLGKGAPVVLEATEYTSNAYIGVQGTTDTTAVIIGVLADTLEAEAVGTAIVYGFGEVLCDEAVDSGDNLGASTTSGEADDNNTNAQSMFAIALETSSGRALVDCFIRCK